MKNKKRNITIFFLFSTCFLVVLSISFALNTKKTSIPLSDIHPDASPFDKDGSSNSVTIKDDTIPNAPNSGENSKDTTVYNLEEYCDNVDLTQNFLKFVKSLNETENKLFIIPEGKTLLLNNYFPIPSNTTIQGGTIEISSDATCADVYNEAFIVNKHSATYWDGKQDSNITLQNVTINYDCSKKGKSLLRFRNIDNVVIENCNINVINSQHTTMSHNAAIDLFKGCTNVVISKNTITLDNPNGNAGGAIWVRSALIKNNDPAKLETSHVKISENTITSNSSDELIAVGSSGYDTSYVSIENNTLIREDGSKKNLMLAICATTAGNIKNINVSENTLLMKNTAPEKNKEIVRVGGDLPTTKYNYILENISLSSNKITGTLTNSKAIVVKADETNNASVSISSNQITNTADTDTNSIGIIATGPNILSQNTFQQIQQQIISDSNTIFLSVE